MFYFMPKMDISGHKFGLLTAIKIDDQRMSPHTYWICQCDCGNTCSVYLGNLRRGHTSSCGCVTKKLLSSSRMIHGHNIKHRVSSEYSTWVSMKSRCNNPNSTSYKLYGEKGVSVCKQWNDSFQCFFNDMGPKPTKNHSIDRYPDKNGNYEPGNCRWATDKEQNRNRSNTKWITYNNKQILIPDLAVLLNTTSS